MFHIDKIFLCSFLTVNGPMCDESTNNIHLQGIILNSSIIEAEISEIARKCAPRVHLKSPVHLYGVYIIATKFCC